MISGATRGAGGSALGAHLASARFNESVDLQQSRGLISEDIKSQIDELTEMGSHARTRKPIYHVHLDPPANQPLSPSERADYWERFEKEFKLENRPFCSVIHLKEGREHEHRAYLAIEPSGKAIRFDHDFARREKLNRIFEIERGEKLTIGAHNKAVINALEKENKPELAQIMRDAGLDKAPKPLAISPVERLQQERTGIDKNDVAQSVLTCWQQSDDGKSFSQALQEQRLTLAHGQKCPVIIDETGNTHALGRLLNIATKENGIDRIPAPAITERISTAEIPTVQSFQEFRAQLPTPTPKTPAENIGKTEASDVSAHPTKAPTECGGGGGRGSPAPQAPTAQPQSTPAQEAIDGPGAPPGPGASWNEKQAYEKRKIEYDERKNRAEEARRRGLTQPKPTTTTQGGGSHEPTEQQKRAGIEARNTLAHWLSAPRPRPAQPSDSRTEIGRGISADIESQRQARTLSSLLQRDRVSDKQREESRTVAPTDRAEPAGNQHDSTVAGIDSGTERSVESDRKRINVAKFQDRKIENTLNKILSPQKKTFIERTIQALSKPMTVEQITEKNIRYKQKQIDNILSTRPNISDNDLNRDFQKVKLCVELFEGIKARKKDIELYEKNAQFAQSQVSGWAKFVPWQTESELKAEQAQKKFTELSKNFGKLNFNDNGKIANSSEMAKYLAEENRKILWKWENKTEIKTALYTQDLLNGASNTAGTGNEQMKSLLAENRIKEALELQKKIEDAQKEQALKNQQKIANQSNPSAAVAAPSGPRMR